MVLTPLVVRLVALIAQAVSLSAGIVGALGTAVAPPPCWVTPAADDEVEQTPPAPDLPAPRMLVHRRAPSWCERRDELGCGRARVPNTGRTSASLEGSGHNPGLPSLRRPLRRGLPRPRAEGRLLGTVRRQPSRPGTARTARPPARRSRVSRPPQPTADEVVGTWSPVIPAKVVPTQTAGDIDGKRERGHRP